jgi:hypothetical protein
VGRRWIVLAKLAKLAKLFLEVGLEVWLLYGGREK